MAIKYKPKHRFKEFLFRWGLRKKCPWCGYKLIENGYPDDGFQRMSCLSERCNFGKGEYEEHEDKPLHTYHITDKNKAFWIMHSTEELKEFKKVLLPGCKVKEI